MARFAFVPAPYPSHLRLFEALAERLAARGHEVLFVLGAGAGALLAPGLDRREVRGVATGRRRASRSPGPLGILRTVADGVALTDALCADMPAILAEWRTDMVVGDEMEPAAGLVAAHLGLAFASVAAALPMETGPGIPLPFLDWPFDPSPEGLKRNAGGVRVANLLLHRQRQGIERWSRRFGLEVRHSLTDCLSPQLRLAQIVAGLDFPRPGGTALRRIGPIRSAPPVAGKLPFEPDPARPLVFASFGTLQGHRFGLFAKIAEACRAIGAQLAVAHCGGLSAEQARRLDATFVTDFLPLPAVMARADLCVTHGGMNTVMDALGHGVPLLCLPLAFDQPGVAARVVHHGVGEKLGRVLLSSARIAASLERLLQSSETRARAAAIGREIVASGGAERAVALIEQTLAEAYPRRSDMPLAVA